MTDRFKITPAVFLVLEKDGNYFLMRRSNTGHKDGEYGLISGHFEGQETPRQAMVREAKEEAGIQISPLDLKLKHVMSRVSDAGAGERIDLFFTVKNWQGEPINNEPEKCDQVIWADKNSLPENTISYIRQALENIKSEIPYSEHGWDE
jgi:8-oxo-dGTP diphosphatase